MAKKKTDNSAQKEKKDNKNKKLSKRKKADNSTIPRDVVETMFEMRVKGSTFKEISEKFGYSVRRLHSLSSREGWKERKQKLLDKVEKKSEKLICDSIIYDKKKRVQVLANYFNSLLKYSENLSKKDFMLVWADLKNLDRIYKLMHFEINDGVTKTETNTTTTGTVEVREIREYIKQPDKANFLRLLRGGKKSE